MRLNYFVKRLPTLGRWVATALLFLSAFVWVWQNPFSVKAALANPVMVATRDAADQVQDQMGRSKGFIEDTKNKVEQTAKNNAKRVERATDGDGNFLERRAKNDAARIEKRAEEDADRTQKAVDASKNAVERAVDGIKDTFGG